MSDFESHIGPMGAVFAAHPAPPVLSTQQGGKLAYTIPEACAATGIGRSLLYERIAAGRLVARKDGTKTIILAADLAAYLAALPPLEVK